MTKSFDVLPCGYVAFRDDGIVTLCNKTLASWLGYPKEEITGRNVEMIFTLATRIFYNTHFFPLIRLHSSANEIFLSLKSKSNNDIPVLANAHRTTDGGESEIHCVFMRVEERKKYEQELLEARRQAENALTENKHLAGLTDALRQHSIELERQYQHQMMMTENLLQFNKIISHDLQEPIRKIQMFTDLLITDVGTQLSDRSKKVALKIDVAAQRLKTLTTSLQQYITVDHERIYTEVDLTAIIEDARSRASTARHFFDFDLHIGKLPTVIDGYKRQLELMFFHLMDNAIQFRSIERRLHVKVDYMMLQENIFRVSKDGYKYTDHLRVSFEDNGIGFPEEYRENVFQLFKKLDHSTSSMGIGLPLVKKIVQNHLGNVRVSSEPGSGTRFEIELPVRITN